METTKELEELVEAAKDILNVDEVDPNASLGNIGIDSLNVVELILACEEIYTGVLDPESLEFDEFTTLADLDQRLRSSALHAM